MRPKIHETPREWYECMHLGTDAVRRPYALRQFPHRGWPRVSVFHLPSFNDCYGWTVYESRDEPQVTLQTIVWRQTSDGARIHEVLMGRAKSVSAEPTLEETLSSIDAVWLERKMHDLAKIRIPLIIECDFGLDGETYGLCVPGRFELEWWVDAPREWEDLARWTYDCIDAFRKA